jgi:hypothetical protein
VAAYKGDALIGRLHGGTLSGSRLDVFESAWLPDLFVAFREALTARHEAARARSAETWASIDPDLPRRITERLHKRIISILRERHHGGALLLMPAEQNADVSPVDTYIDLKVRFANAGRTSFPDLIVEILNRLAQLHGSADPNRVARVSWPEFEATIDDEIATLDEALFETAHLFADLAAVDGAVVLSNDHALLGFGGMISGRLPDVDRVWKALDLEGVELVEEAIGNVGARHRAAYRLAGAVPGLVAIVISQDGGVRFVSQTDGRVAYWEQE